MADLDALLALLDDGDVTEVVLTSGQPATARRHGGYQPIGSEVMEVADIIRLIGGTPLARLLDGGGGQITPVQIGARSCRAEVNQFGDQVMVRLLRSPRRAVAAAPPAPVRFKLDDPPPVVFAPPAAAAPPPPARPMRATTIPPFVDNPMPPLQPIAAARAPAAFVALVEDARRRRATDLHVTGGQPAMIRSVDGLAPLGAVLDDDTVEAMLLPLLTPLQRGQLEQRGYVDTAIDLGRVARLRANLSRTRAGLKGAFRVVLPAPPTLEQLMLPAELAKVTTYHQGLVVIAGPNGHGKTTTLAALIDLINSTKPHHILTVEDPVEILHPRKRALISQREVGAHTRSFASALKASLREDPDVIVIGELRDRETVEIALTAAETGHLVLATMSTPSAAKTLDRLIDMFPPDDQPQVRSSLAAALRFVVAQRLLPSADGTGLVAAIELLTGVLPLAALIRDDKLYQINSLQQRGRAFGMIRLDDSLAELVRIGRITEEVALRTAESKRELTAALRPAPAPAAPAAPAAGGLKSRFGSMFKKDKE